MSNFFRSPSSLVRVFYPLVRSLGALQGALKGSLGGYIWNHTPLSIFFQLFGILEVILRNSLWDVWAWDLSSFLILFCKVGILAKDRFKEHSCWIPAPWFEKDASAVSSSNYFPLSFCSKNISRSTTATYLRRKQVLLEAAMAESAKPSSSLLNALSLFPSFTFSLSLSKLSLFLPLSSLIVSPFPPSRWGVRFSPVWSPSSDLNLSVLLFFLFHCLSTHLPFHSLLSQLVPLHPLSSSLLLPSQHHWQPSSPLILSPPHPPLILPPTGCDACKCQDYAPCHLSHCTMHNAHCAMPNAIEHELCIVHWAVCIG